MTPKPALSGQLRALTGRRVLFAAALSVAVLSLIVLFAWPIFDASYRYASWLAKVDLGLEKVAATDPTADAVFGLTDTMLSSANRSDQLGSRVVLLYVLFCLGLGATLALIVGCVRSKSITRKVAAAAVVGGWIALDASQSAVEEWSTRRHVEQFLPRAEAAAALLQAHWPTRSGNIGPRLRVIVSDRHPNALFVEGRRAYPVDEDFGYLIERSIDRTFRFKLSGAYDCNLEWHPPGSIPTAYVDALGMQSTPAVRATQLKDGWYLVRYAGGRAI
jgi:hypothetical protein